MKNNQLELIIGKNLAKILANNNANYLIKSIKKLREKSKHFIPEIHITDGIKIDENDFEIRFLNKILAKQNITQDKQLEKIIEEIIKNLNYVCEKTNNFE